MNVFGEFSDQAIFGYGNYRNDTNQQVRQGERTAAKFLFCLDAPMARARANLFGNFRLGFHQYHPEKAINLQTFVKVALITSTNCAINKQLEGMLLSIYVLI